MSANPQAAVQGDVNDERTVTLGGVADLDTVSSVVAHVAHARDSTDRTQLAAVVTDGTLRTVTVSLGTWLSDGPEIGPWYIEIQTTWADGSVLTWPKDTLDVIEQLDPPD